MSDSNSQKLQYWSVARPDRPLLWWTPPCHGRGACVPWRSLKLSRPKLINPWQVQPSLTGWEGETRQSLFSLLSFLSYISIFFLDLVCLLSLALNDWKFVDGPYNPNQSLTHSNRHRPRELQNKGKVKSRKDDKSQNCSSTKAQTYIKHRGWSKV